MNNHTTCYICNEKVSFPGKNKHLFSKQHSQHIKSAILTRKGEFMTWIGHVEKRTIKRIPIIRFANKPYKICFVCKKISPDCDSYVNCPCGKTTENAEIIKNILATSTDTPATTPLTQSGDSLELQEENMRLKEEIEKLKASNQKLTTQKKDLQRDLADAQEPYDCLYHILSHYQERDTDRFKNVLSLIKGDCYSSTYTKIKNELYLDEDE